MLSAMSTRLAQRVARADIEDLQKLVQAIVSWWGYEGEASRKEEEVGKRK
jgi:hypothetical protein